MRLFLIRHAQSYINLPDWDGGVVDVGLTEVGQRQAALMAHFVAEKLKPTRLYASTLTRTLETAACLSESTGLEIHPEDRAREFGHCYPGGQPIPVELMPIQYADFWGTSRPYAPISKGRESWVEFRARVGAVLEDLVLAYGEDAEERVILVCHGGVVEAAIDAVFNVAPHRQVEVKTPNVGGAHLEYALRPGREPWIIHALGPVFGVNQSTF